MKIFCSFAQTGEDDAVVLRRITRVVDVLKSQGHEVYCILFDDSRDAASPNGDLLKHALGRINTYDIVLAILTSDRRSEGMLMEIGAALAYDKPIYLLQHESAVGKTYLSEIADKTIVWHDELELENAVKTITAGNEHATSS